MRPHPRIRKTVKWGGAVVTVLLVVVWIGSGWRLVVRETGGGDWANMHSGALRVFHWVNRPGIRADAAWHFQRWPYTGFEWRPSFERDAYHTYLTVPIWCPVLVALGPTAIAWRLDAAAYRRARLNYCPKCGYDRTGLAIGAVCPECGKLPA